MIVEKDDAIIAKRMQESLRKELEDVRIHMDEESAIYSSSLIQQKRQCDDMRYENEEYKRVIAEKNEEISHIYDELMTSRKIQNNSSDDTTRLRN
jgi:UDP-glucose 6-dehydrogenase